MRKYITDQSVINFMKPLHALRSPPPPALLAACSCPETRPCAGARRAHVMTVAPRVGRWNHEYAGEVRARTESRLGFRVGGKIVRRDADLGDNVKAGQHSGAARPAGSAARAGTAKAAVVGRAGEPRPRPRPTSSASGTARPGLHPARPNWSAANRAQGRRRRSWSRRGAEQRAGGNQAAYAPAGWPMPMA